MFVCLFVCLHIQSFVTTISKLIHLSHTRCGTMLKNQRHLSAMSSMQGHISSLLTYSITSGKSSRKTMKMSSCKTTCTTLFSSRNLRSTYSCNAHTYAHTHAHTHAHAHTHTHTHMHTHAHTHTHTHTQS